jgi:hypothetical protein
MGVSLFARDDSGMLLVNFKYELDARQTIRRYRYNWRGGEYTQRVAPNSRMSSNNWAITNFDNLYEGVPKWAIKEYNAEKNKLTEKNIFTDKEGLWGNLPLDVLVLIMTYHSRNNNRYWGGISFCANLRKNFSRSAYTYVKNDRDYNPYKNVDIFQNTTRYDWRNNQIPINVSLSEFYKIEQSFIQQRQMTLTTYGKARDNHRAVVNDLNKLLTIFERGTAKHGYTKIFPSKMKFKWVTDDLNTNGQMKNLLDYDEVGLTLKERNKGIKRCLYLCGKDTFTAKHGFLKHQYNIIVIKKKLGKREIKAIREVFIWKSNKSFIKNAHTYICY